MIAPDVSDPQPLDDLDEAFLKMMMWVYDPASPIFGDNARDRTIRALRFLSASTFKDQATDLIAASLSKERLQRWRTFKCPSDPYATNLLKTISKQRQQIAELEAKLNDR